MSDLPPHKDECPDDTAQDRDNPSFQPLKTSERLNQIDRVRANGIGDHIALPQLVVCGDQSAGKSSILEGITGYPFPRQDGLCTQFPTEIVLRHNSIESKMAASLIPSSSRSAEDKEKFAAFNRDFQDFGKLPNLIEEASRLIGVRGFSESEDAPAFAMDVLRLELVGNTGLHLTLVDLPGLISVSEDDRDVDLVQRLVDSYLESSRTIILAVIPASSDPETQRIIQRARHFDKEGVRTVGIITKPDLINKGTEARVARLANNLDRTKLKLGFFLLKNPSPAELARGMPLPQRRRAELDFFSSGPWKAQGLDPSRVGIDNLRLFLQELLDSHIERELPKVREEIRRFLTRVREEASDLGIERSQPSQIRIFLTRVSAEFYSIVRNGLEGNYEVQCRAFFSNDDSDKYRRLRAAVHTENERFADYVRKHGQQRKVVSDDEPVEEPWDDELENEQLEVSSSEMSAWVKEMYHQSRGRELPRNYNHSLLQSLFLVQSSRWGEISRRHVESIVKLVTRFMDSALKFVIKDSKVRDGLRRSIMDSLNDNVRQAHEELGRLLEDERGHPITYNHYYTDNIQHARHDDVKDCIQKTADNAMLRNWDGKFHFTNSSDEFKKMVAALQQNIELDMVDRACSEALTDLNAYYKVAMKTFVDNVCRQVVERHILATLGSVFDPTVVSSYADDELTRLAAESPQTSRRRVEVLQLQKSLEESLKELSS